MHEDIGRAAVGALLSNALLLQTALASYKLTLSSQPQDSEHESTPMTQMSQ